MSEVVGNVRVYCGGGLGANIGSQFLSQTGGKGFAALQPVFLDTSRSNLNANIPEDKIYLVKGATERDGSGKKRDENYGPIRESVKDMLLKHKPLDFNIVLFSTSGGSGSVICPLIIRELLLREQAVVAVIVGSDESAKSAQNAIDTLESLEGISNKAGRVLPAFYRHNFRGRSQKETDSAIIGAIGALGILFSRQLTALDVSDVYNFLNYDRVTSIRPQLVQLEISPGNAAASELKRLSPITMVSIYPDKDSPEVDLVPDYLAVGYGAVNVNGSDTVHYTIDLTGPSLWHAALKKTVDQLEEVRAARPQQQRLQSTDVDDFGMKV